jgi:hypothetical protein
LAIQVSEFSYLTTFSGGALDNDADTTNQQPTANGSNHDSEEQRVAEGAQRTSGEGDTNNNQTESHGRPKPLLVLRILRVLWRRRQWRIIGGNHGPNWAETSIVILTIGILAVGYLQYRVYRKQARLMQDSLNQTERSVILNMGQLGFAKIQDDERTTEATRQFSQLQESNRINREALESVQRAFVSLAHLQQEETLAYGTSYIAFHSQWENVGVTSANVTDYLFEDGKLSREPSDDQFEHGVETKPLHVSRYIGPHDPYWVGPFMIRTDVLLGSISPQKTERYFFWGWIVYRDVFKHTRLHVTEFCRKATDVGQAISESDKTNIKPFVRLEFCEEHNCADEQCKDYGQLIKSIRKR